MAEWYAEVFSRPEWADRKCSEMTNLAHLTPALLAHAVPLGRSGTLAEMAGPVLFLAGRAGAYVNGAVWLVDGGRVGQVASSY